MRLTFLESRPGPHDEIGFVMRAIARVRAQWFPFLWKDPSWSNKTMMDTARGTAAIILLEDTYPTQRALYNAVQRALYAEARSWGWRRERNSQRFTPPTPTLPLDNDENVCYHLTNSKRDQTQ